MKKLRLFATILLLSLAMILSLSAVKAQVTEIAVIDAVEGDDTIMLPPETPAGTQFLVNVTIKDVTLLAGWQINITFDPALIIINETTDVFLPADHIFNGLDPTGPGVDVNNATGYVMWARAVGPAAPVNHFNGSGVICQIRFTTVKNGTGEPTQCQIGVDKQGLYPTDIVDPDANSIAFTAVNGNYIIPEFPTTTILVIFFTISLIAVVLARKTLIKRGKFLITQ